MQITPDARVGWQRTDLLLMAMLMVLAAGLRFFAWSRLGIDHYDEGGYAMSAMAVDEWRLDLLYPQQQLLSPPLYFVLSGMVMRLLGMPSDQALFLVSALAGILTIGAIYAMGKIIHGREAGTAAALLIAMSDYHIGFSRTGLTDVTFCLFFLLALLAYIHAERQESFAWSVLAGVLTGCAWNTKYHGWLSGVVAGVALLPYLLHGDWKRFRAGFARVFIAGVVATLCYIPWVIYVQGQEGGYLALAKYQSGYLDSSGYLSHIIAHIRAQYFLNGWSGAIAPVVAFLALALCYSRINTVIILAAIALLLGGLSVGESTVVMLLAPVALIQFGRNGMDYARSVSAAFFLVFAILSPFYQPYARLLLPLMCAAYLLAGAGMAGFLKKGISVTRRCSVYRQLVPLAAVSVMAGALVLTKGMATWGHTWGDRTGIRSSINSIREVIPRGSKVAVIGEPAVVFYLRTIGYRVVHLNRWEDIYHYFQPGTQVYFLCGHYACYRQGELMKVYPGVFARVGTARVNAVSETRLFDDKSPWNAVRWDAGAHHDYDFQIFRLLLPPPAAKPDPGKSVGK